MFKIDKIKEKEFFLNRIKGKFDIIILLLNILDYILLFGLHCKNPIWIIEIIKKNKMQRIFLFSDKKYYSINFPFSINDNKIFFGSEAIDAHQISILRGILLELKDRKSIQFEDLFDIFYHNELSDYKCSRDDINRLFNIFYNLLIMDDWYIRYDYDEKSENWNKHPLCHYDIFYSNQNWIKIWLNKAINKDTFIDMIDPTTDCHFLQ